MMCVFCRYLENNNLPDFPIIYMCLEVSKHISFYSWDLCNTKNVVLQTVPYNIYRYIKTSNMGVFDKLKPKFLQLCKEKYVFVM